MLTGFRVGSDPDQHEQIALYYQLEAQGQSTQPSLTTVGGAALTHIDALGTQYATASAAAAVAGSSSTGDGAEADEREPIRCAWCTRCGNRPEPFNLHILATCLILIAYASYVIITARGFFTVLQGIFGVIFAIEGARNSKRYIPSGISKFIGFLFAYCLLSAAIGIIHLNTIDLYCQSATPKNHASCVELSTLHAWLNFLGAVVIIPILIFIFRIYLAAVRRYVKRTQRTQANRRRKVAFRSTVGGGGGGTGGAAPSVPTAATAAPASSTASSTAAQSITGDH